MPRKQTGHQITGVSVINCNVNSDERRDLVPIHNSGPEDISKVGQIKELVGRKKPGAWLGGAVGHYHHYEERFYCSSRTTTVFYLRHKDDPADRVQIVVLRRGQMLVIPEHVAHKVWAPKGARIIGITEQPYTSSDQDISCEVTVPD